MHAFETVISVRWGDMDALGHVNNACYFRYMEQARIEWLKAIGEDFSMETQGPILATAQCNYLKPVTYPASLRVQVSGEKPGRSSFVLRYRLLLADSAEVVAEGETVIVWVDYQAQQSVPLPESLRQQLAVNSETPG